MVVLLKNLLDHMPWQRKLDPLLSLWSFDSGSKFLFCVCVMPNKIYVQKCTWKVPPYIVHTQKQEKHGLCPTDLNLFMFGIHKWAQLWKRNKK